MSMQSVNLRIAMAAQAEREVAAGRLAQAAEQYASLVRLYPDDAQLRHNLGFVYLSVERLQDALQELNRACQLAPGQSLFRMRRGVVLQKMGRVMDALKDYEARLADTPDDAVTLANMAAGYMTLGDLDAALRCAQLGVVKDASYAIAWNNLGQVLYQRGEFSQAEPVLRRALALAPQFADACCNLADTLRAIYRDDEAEQWYRSALRFAPDHVAAAVNFANMLVSNGRNDEAIDLYQSVLNRTPDHDDALNNLCSALIEAGREDEAAALLAPFMNQEPRSAFRAALYARALMLQGDKEGARAVLQQELASLHPAVLETWATLSEGDPQRLQQSIQALRDWVQTQETKAAVPLRVSLRLALASQLEKIGEYRQAFSAASEAKALIPRREDPAALQQQFSALTQAFNAARLARGPYGLEGETRPVFVLGMPRSGTSLVEQMLSMHQEVHAAGELEEFNRISSELGAPFDLQWPARLAALDAFSLQALAERWLSVAAPRNGSPRYIVDKIPHNFVMVGLISILFPQAKIVHVQRDPRDICLSIFFSNFTGHHPYQNNIEDIARHYNFYANLMQFWKKSSRIAMHELRYEDLATDPDVTGRNLFEFLDLKWNPDFINVHQSQRAALTTSRLQVKKPIYRSSIERWRNYAQELEPAIRLLAPVLEDES